MAFKITIQNFKEKGGLLLSDRLKRCISIKRVTQLCL